MLMIWHDGLLGDEVRGKVLDQLCVEIRRQSRTTEIVFEAAGERLRSAREDVPVLVVCSPQTTPEEITRTALLANGVLLLTVDAPGDKRRVLGIPRETEVWAMVVTNHLIDPKGIAETAGAKNAWVTSSETKTSTMRSAAKALRPATEGGLRSEGTAAVTTAIGRDVAYEWIADLLDDYTVEEYTVIGGRRLIVDRGGRTKEERPSPCATDDELIAFLQHLASFGEAGRRVRFDKLQPRLDIQLLNRWRAHGEAFVVAPPVLTLRSNKGADVKLDELDLAEPDALAVLRQAISGTARGNIVLGAPMSAGKTTFCQALLRECPPTERIDTIEDTPELRLAAHGLHTFTVERLVQEANNDGVGAFSMEYHIRQAKRSNTSKIVVGEVRGEGTLALLDAMTSGLAGSIATLHSPPGEAILSKLLNYAAREGAKPEYAAREIYEAIDLVVWLGRSTEGLRRIGDISEITGFDKDTGAIHTAPLWKLRSGDNYAARVGSPSTDTVRRIFTAAGVDPDLPPPSDGGLNLPTPLRRPAAWSQPA